MESKKIEQKDCSYCGTCPVCGQSNNHYYHKHPPWVRFPCHPFFDSNGEKEEEVKNES